MFTTLFLTLSLAWQSPDVTGTRPLDLIELMYEHQAQQEAMSKVFDRQLDMTKQRQFELRYNDLAKALAAFGETWNQSHRIDERKAQRLRKAWRNLGKTDAWFDTSSASK